MAKPDQPPRPRGTEPHHRLYVALWDNPDFLSLDCDGRNVWRYVVAGPNRVTEGLFQLPIRDAEHHLDIDGRKVRACLRELERLGVIVWDNEREHVLLLGALAFQGTTNENSARSVVNRAASLRNENLMLRWLECAARFGELRLAAELRAHFHRMGINPDAPAESVAVATIPPNTLHQSEAQDQHPASPCNSPAQSPAQSPSGDKSVVQKTSAVGERVLHENLESDAWAFNEAAS